MKVEQEIARAIATPGVNSNILEALEEAHTHILELNPDARAVVDESVAILETVREQHDVGQESTLPPRLLELFEGITPADRGAILRVSTVVFALRAVRSQDPQTLKEEE